MTRLVAIQPFLWVQFFRWLMELQPTLVDLRLVLLRELRRTDKLARRHDELVDVYWKLSWATGHLVALAMAGGPTQFEGLSEEDVETIARLDCTRIALETGIIGITLRGVWATARLGKLALPYQKRQYQEAERYIDVASSGLSLVAIGHRHARLRAEVGKVLETGPRLSGEDLVSDLVRDAAGTIAGQWTMFMDEPDVLAAIHRENGADLALLASRMASPGSPYQFERMVDVPDALASCIAANSPVEWMESPEMLGSLGAVPWVSRAGLEDLHLPADFLTAARGVWDAAWAKPVLLSAREPFLWARPIQQAPKVVSRKGPCPCGSGKKYKRCCGA
ncbi:YecA family protein [Polyangium jinanense]|uniref:SEC-C domain-containing protein n=2 Tax=Polyangium jinanense TaxID=2829994 RepID=A0A9X4AXS1_9BACT|nr:SEC-C metal-binding domain-containing protein [Polyangium jinanense]MDC3986525.1 SEC-C domain-containing protein [Polyangium jinanense]